MQRTLMGLLSLVAASVYLLTLFTSGLNEGHAKFISGVCLKSAMVLGAIWLAYPQLQQLFQRFPGWVWGVSGVAVVALILHRSLLVAVLGLFAILCFFQLVGRFLPPGRKARSPAKTKSSPPDNPNPSDG